MDVWRQLRRQESPVESSRLVTIFRPQSECTHFQMSCNVFLKRQCAMLTRERSSREGEEKAGQTRPSNNRVKFNTVLRMS